MHTVHRRSSARNQLLRAIAGFGVAATIIGLSACSATPEAKPSTSASAGVIDYKDFSFTSWNYGEAAQKQLITDEVAGFTDGKSIQATIGSFPFADYRNQLLLRSANGDLSGAAQLDIADIAALGRLGVLADLTQQAKTGGYTDAALKGGQYDGKQLGLPWYTGSIGMVSNSDLLKKAGITSTPTTIAEFEKALEAVKALGADYVPYSLATKPEAIKDFIPWFRTFGSKVLDGKTVAVNDKGAVEALTWIKSLLDKGLVKLNFGRPEARTLYSQEKTAFIDDANQVRGTIKTQAKNAGLLGFTEPIARPVVKKGDTPQSLSWGGLIVVFKDGNAATASAFASFMTSDTKSNVERFQTIGSAPTTKAALADPSFAGDPYSAAWQKNITATSQRDPFWVFPQYAQMESKLAVEIQAALLGTKTPKAALDAAQAAMQALVK